MPNRDREIKRYTPNMYYEAEGLINGLLSIGSKSHTMRYPLIGLSVIPALPIVLFSAGFVVSGRGPKGEVWYLLCAATVLGLCGIIGLILASLERTYAVSSGRYRSILLILFGHIAVVVAVYGIFLMHNQQPPGVLHREVNEPFPVTQLTIVLLLLSWPIISGIAAISNLSRKNS